MLINKSYRIVASTVLFVAVILLIVFSYSNYNLRVNQITGGFLDLSGMDLESTIYSLDGNWIFWPEEYVDPVAAVSLQTTEQGGADHQAYLGVTDSAALPAAQEIKVPGSLYQLSPNQKDKIKSGTYQLKIRLDEPGTYGLKTSLVSGAEGDTENVYYFQTMQTIKSAAIIGIFVGLGIYLLLLTCATSHQKTGLCLSTLCVGSALLESLLDETIEQSARSQKR